MLVLFESPSGYAIFKVLDESKVQAADDLHELFANPEKAANSVKLKHFKKFEDTTEALAATTAAVEGKLSKTLKKVLKKIVAKEAHEELAVADAKLGQAIKEKMNLTCVYSPATQELMRGIRAHIDSLISGIPERDMTAMALGLAHSLSRYKLKFSPDKVDTMIVQAISLLDDLDKELNNYIMRCREWYGWHFPELGKVVTDHIAFAKIIKKMGVRTNAASCDMSEILPEEIEKQVVDLAQVSMGTEISEEDIINISYLADQIIEITEYRGQLYDYLKNRMTAMAPNLTLLVGELVGARLISHAGTPQVISSHFSLPISIVAKPSSPVKKQDHKVTLETNEPCVNLMELLPELCQSDSGPSCVGLEYIHGPKATILTSKSSNRYRIQCDEYEGLGLVTNEVVVRLQKRGLKVSTQDPVNMIEYFNLVDQHHLLRIGNEQLMFGLEQRAQQYRAIQRRLLTRFKDKTPSPLNCLDTLLDGTHAQLLSLADAISEHHERMRVVSNMLSSASMLLVLLTTLHHHLPPPDAHLMQSAFCCAHTHTGPNVPGWEEMVEVSMASLLKLLGNRDNSATTNDLKFPESTKKLKKKISMVVDRMGKGGRLTNHRNLTDIPGSRERGKESEEFADDITTDDITANDITADVYNGMDSLKGGFPTMEVRTPETNGFDHRYADHKSGIYAGKAPTIPSGNIEENDGPKYDTTHSSDSLNEIESPAFYDDYSLLT